MRSIPLAACALILASTAAAAEERRQLGAHEHGRGTLNMAVEGNTLAMDLRVPGADIVGFEHAAETDDQKAALADAKKKLLNPLALFRLPEAAGCVLDSDFVHFTKDPEHAEHHAKHHGGDHGHGKHDHGKEHGKEHGKGGHDHGKKGHDHAHSGKHHDGHHHGHEDGHAEFHAGYELTCAAPDKLASVTFAFFKAFPGARVLEVNLVTAKGQSSFEVTADKPDLALGGLM